MKKLSQTRGSFFYALMPDRPHHFSNFFHGEAKKFIFNVLPFYSNLINKEISLSAILVNHIRHNSSQ